MLGVNGLSKASNTYLLPQYQSILYGGGW